MKAVTRITIGAATGSLAVLLLHPLSRPYVLNGFSRFGESRVARSSNLLPSNYSVLPKPTNLIEASIWVHVGADRLVLREPMSKANLDVLIEVVLDSERKDPQNAFWAQILAVLEDERGRKADAIANWERAAHCSSWNDFQSSRFDKVKNELAKESRLDQSWHSSLLYYQRSKSAAILINRYGKSILRGRGVTDPNDLALRVQTLENGALLRDNSRSVKVGIFGVDLVEASSIKNRFPISVSPRKLITARFELINQLRKNGFERELGIANRAFYANDAWLALLVKEETDESIRNWSFFSVFVASVPGALLLTSAVSFVLAFFISLGSKFPVLMRIFKNPIAPIIGLILGIGVYYSTELAFVALTFVGCFSFLGLGPSKERTAPSTDLGPLFDLTVGLLALLYSGFLCAFFVGVTTPAVEVFENMNIPQEFFAGGSLPLWLAGITMSLLFLVAPLWALATRIATHQIVGIALRYFAFDSALLCLFLGIASVPIAIYADTVLEPTLSKVLLNEPTYYLTQ